MCTALLLRFFANIRDIQRMLSPVWNKYIRIHFPMYACTRKLLPQFLLIYLPLRPRSRVVRMYCPPHFVIALGFKVNQLATLNRIAIPIHEGKMGIGLCKRRQMMPAIHPLLDYTIAQRFEKQSHQIY